MPLSRLTFGGTEIRTCAKEAYVHDMLQQVASNATAMGPAILLQSMHLQRPIDVVKVAALPTDDKRTILVM